jgi:1,4-alpha-glucan branching enzyme
VSRDRGALAIVLHTHMPYVEGFGTWPFGEEWLWEAIACCYLPLLELLERDLPVTLSLTPVLCDQLEVAGIAQRFAGFIEEVRSATHAEDAAGLRAAGHEQLAGAVERSWCDYERALEAMDARGGDLLSAFAPFAQWTSAATHAVLPLLAGDAGVRLQVRAGIAAHLRRFGSWRGGFWLPECGYAPWLADGLADAGVRAVCVELTDSYGLGSPEHLRPLLSDEGIVLVPIDRASIALVWSDDGYPAAGAYRDYHHHTVHHHNPWNNAGGAYDRDAAHTLAREHAADFVARTLERLRAGREQALAGRRAGFGGTGDAHLPGGGLAVCALDTELLGHWWYEGLQWLEAVAAECERQGLELVRLDDALERFEPRVLPAGASPSAPSSWGSGGDLSTWSGPAVADMAFAARAAELEVLGAAHEISDVAIRELLALQSSDWAFMCSRAIAKPYARERFERHRSALEQALRDGQLHDSDELRNLAAHAHRSLILMP